MGVFRSESLLGAIRRQRPRKELRLGRVEGIRGDGTYVVARVVIPAAGPAQLEVGELVWVAYERQRPTLIVRTAARFSRRPASGAPPEGGTVEELFVAPNPDLQNQPDIWFRNQDTVEPLAVRLLLPLDPTGVKWGQDRNSFVVKMGEYRFAAFRFEREDDQAPFRAGALPEPGLEATWDLLAPELTLLDGTFTRTGSGTRITATQTWEETHKATIQSFTIQNPGPPNNPNECLVVGVSTTCRTAAQYQAFLSNEGIYRATMPSPPSCVEPGTGHQLEVLSFVASPPVASPPPEDEHLGIVKKNEGAVSVNTVVRRLVKLNQTLVDEVAQAEGSGSTPEFTPIVQDYSLTADHTVLVVVLLKIHFLGDIKAGDTQTQSSVAYRYSESFMDPSWVTPLQAIVQSPDTAPSIKAAFDIRETHAYVIDLTHGQILWATTGAHQSPVKTLTIQESYATLDTKSALAQAAFDGAWLNWDQLVNTGIEPPHGGTKIGTAGQSTLVGAWSHVVGDPLFIGIGLSTMEARRVVAINAGNVNVLDAPLSYDHYEGEPIRPVPALVYWEPQQTGDPACEIPRSLVDTVEPSNAALPGAKAMALGGIGTQGRTGFQNDLWGVSGIDTSDQYSSTDQAVTGTPHFNNASYLISVPLNYGDDFFTGLEVSWSFAWRWVRQLTRYRVQDLRLLKWDPDAIDRRWWLVLEAYDLLTGQPAVTGLVLDGAFTVLTTVAMQAAGTVTLLAATPHHAVWHETTATAQRLGVLDIDRDTTAVTTVLASTPDLKALWQSPDLRGLAPDLLYRTLAEGEETFVLAWDSETGEILLDPLAQDFPADDSTLEGRGDLAALPGTVASVEPSAARSFQALNRDDEFGAEPGLDQ